MDDGNHARERAIKGSVPPSWKFYIGGRLSTEVGGHVEGCVMPILLELKRATLGYFYKTPTGGGGGGAMHSSPVSKTWVKRLLRQCPANFYGWWESCNSSIKGSVPLSWKYYNKMLYLITKRNISVCIHENLYQFPKFQLSIKSKMAISNSWYYVIKAPNKQLFGKMITKFKLFRI